MKLNLTLRRSIRDNNGKINFMGNFTLIQQQMNHQKVWQENCSEEMAAFFSVSEDTLRRNFATVINKGWEAGKMSLRRKQVSVAMGGNVAMLIWLGKQYLGQHDKADFDIQSGVTVIVGKNLEKL
jgi:hypothetical protein